MKLLEGLKGVLRSMAKLLIASTQAESSVLGKRKLNFNYVNFIAESIDSPLISPKLKKKSGEKINEAKKAGHKSVGQGR